MLRDGLSVTSACQGGPVQPIQRGHVMGPRSVARVRCSPGVEPPSRSGGVAAAASLRHLPAPSHLPPPSRGLIRCPPERCTRRNGGASCSPGCHDFCCYSCVWRWPGSLPHSLGREVAARPFPVCHVEASWSWTGRFYYGLLCPITGGAGHT